MSNTIDQNLSSGNNSMNSLQFYWMAEFNKDIILQFENGIEHRFQEVRDRINELEYFHLYHKEKKLKFIVDLKKGFIKFNDCEEPEEIEKKENIRLIFFRRHITAIGEQDLKEKSHSIFYFLGLQWNDKLGNNQKILLQIDSNGNFILSD